MQQKSAKNSKKILVCQNIEREHAGVIGELLKKQEFEIKIVDLNRNIVPKVKNYCAAIVLGGPDSANDQTLKMKHEIMLVRRVLSAEIPFLGICLGMQVLSKAIGGIVKINPVKEIGFRNARGDPYSVYLTKDGRSSQLFKGLPEHFVVFQLHGEAVQPIDIAAQKILATGNDCQVQAIQIGKNAFGVQFHPELNENMLNLWAREDPDLNSLETPSMRLKNGDLASTKSFGTKIIENFLSILP